MSYKNLIKKFSKKQKLIYSFLLVFVLILIIYGLVWHHNNRVRQERIQKQQAAAAAAKKDLEEIRKENQLDSSLAPWYNYHSIAHALGGVDDKKYLNSVDGFYEAYKKGYHIDLNQLVPFSPSFNFYKILYGSLQGSFRRIIPLHTYHWAQKL